MDHVEIEKPDLQESEADTVEGNSCGALVTIRSENSPRGDYVYFWVVNKGGSSATVTVKRKWRYSNDERSDKLTVSVAAGTERSVFSFPDRQSPRCEIVGCKN